MRTEQEIRDSLAEMKRMEESAYRALENATVKQTPFLMETFERWKQRCNARANILKWVLGEPYIKDEPPNFAE